ncbi:hypothetical protein GGI35DRAFT_26238 [Trichoderma velutinum]
MDRANQLTDVYGAADFSEDLFPNTPGAASTYDATQTETTAQVPSADSEPVSHFFDDAMAAHDSARLLDASMEDGAGHLVNDFDPSGGTAGEAGPNHAWDLDDLMFFYELSECNRQMDEEQRQLQLGEQQLQPEPNGQQPHFQLDEQQLHLQLDEQQLQPQVNEQQGQLQPNEQQQQPQQQQLAISLDQPNVSPAQPQLITSPTLDESPAQSQPSEQPLHQEQPQPQQLQLQEHQPQQLQLSEHQQQQFQPQQLQPQGMQQQEMQQQEMQQQEMQQQEPQPQQLQLPENQQLQQEQPVQRQRQRLQIRIQRPRNVRFQRQRVQQRPKTDNRQLQRDTAWLPQEKKDYIRWQQDQAARLQRLESLLSALLVQPQPSESPTQLPKVEQQPLPETTTSQTPNDFNSAPAQAQSNTLLAHDQPPWQTQLATRPLQLAASPAQPQTNASPAQLQFGENPVWPQITASPSQLQQGALPAPVQPTQQQQQQARQNSVQFQFTQQLQLHHQVLWGKLSFIRARIHQIHGWARQFVQTMNTAVRRGASRQAVLDTVQVNVAMRSYVEKWVEQDAENPNSELLLNEPLLPKDEEKRRFDPLFMWTMSASRDMKKAFQGLPFEWIFGQGPDFMPRPLRQIIVECHTVLLDTFNSLLSIMEHDSNLLPYRFTDKQNLSVMSVTDQTQGQGANNADAIDYVTNICSTTILAQCRFVHTLLRDLPQCHVLPKLQQVGAINNDQLRSILQEQQEARKGFPLVMVEPLTIGPNTNNHEICMLENQVYYRLNFILQRLPRKAA